jgi:hypothetical protein
VTGDIPHYPLFVLSGLAVVGFLGPDLARTTSLVSNAELIKRSGSAPELGPLRLCSPSTAAIKQLTSSETNNLIPQYPVRIGAVHVLVLAAPLALGQQQWKPSTKPPPERVLLTPKAGTFYSNDVLNPDVVKRRNLYYLFFSGNQAATDAGAWHTGVAVSKNPFRDFRVLPRMQADFLNGGTRLFGKQFVQMATPPDFGQPRVYKSRDLSHWRRGAMMPAGAPGAWNAYQSDPFYDASGLVYFASRPGPSGADIGVRRYLGGGKWSAARRVLARGAVGTWDSLDLGEPATFRSGKQHFMLYGGLGIPGGRVRSVSPA